MSAPITVLAEIEHPRISRIIHALGAQRLPLAQAGRAPAGVVVAAVDPAQWTGLIRALSGLRPRALVLAVLGAPPLPPQLSSAVARVAFPSQAQARACARLWPLGRLVVVEPAPVAAAAPGGVFVAGEADRLDPERIVAAARGGAAIVSDRAHEVLPPGAVVGADVAAAVASLQAEPARRAALGAQARAWAARGREPEDEAHAWRAVVAEVASMSRRGGRGV